MVEARWLRGTELTDDMVAGRLHQPGPALAGTAT